MNRHLPGTAVLVGVVATARVHTRPWTPVLLLGCGFQGLAWICLTCVAWASILFRRSFCPPSYELTPSFSSSELMLPCQPLPSRHPGRNGPALISVLPGMRAHSGRRIGTLLSAFPAETWGLAQLLLDVSLWKQRRREEVPLLQDSQPCCRDERAQQA